MHAVLPELESQDGEVGESLRRVAIDLRLVGALQLDVVAERSGGGSTLGAVPLDVVTHPQAFLHGDRRVEPPVGDTGNPSERWFGRTAEEDRNIHVLGRDHEWVEGEVPAGVRERTTLQRAAHDADRFLEPAPSLGEGHVERGELLGAPSGPETQLEPAAGEVLDGDGSLRDREGMAQRCNQHPGLEHDVVGRRRQSRQRAECVEQQRVRADGLRRLGAGSVGPPALDVHRSDNVVADLEPRETELVGDSRELNDVIRPLPEDRNAEVGHGRLAITNLATVVGEVSARRGTGRRSLRSRGGTVPRRAGRRRSPRPVAPRPAAGGSRPRRDRRRGSRT